MTGKENKAIPHIPVMVEECLKFFENVSLSVFFDGTVGAGGHAFRILKAHPEICTYIGFDKDPEALLIAEKRLEPWKEKVQLVQGNFASLDTYLVKKKIKTVDGFFLT